MVSDLFHAGHVALLPDGCRHGDRLIVGVLSDAGAAAPSLSMGIASSCMTAPPRLKIAYDKDTKGAGGRSHPQLSRPGQHGLWDQGGTDFREPPQRPRQKPRNARTEPGLAERLSGPFALKS